MSDLQQDLETIKDPVKIKEAVYASGPYTLLQAFARDPLVARVIRAGRKAVPLIVEQIKANGLKLDRITLACYVYILMRVDQEAAVAQVRPLFIEAMKKPDPFFPYFAAHVLRRSFNMPVKADDPEYSFAELQETLAWAERSAKPE